MDKSLVQQDSKNKILVIEDEESLQLLYQQELSDEGYQVISSSTAEDAMSILSDNTIDLIVLDIKLPHMGGMEFMEQALLQHRHVKVIINSAFAQFKDDFLSWLADDYIIKSADLTELKSSIRRQLN